MADLMLNPTSVAPTTVRTAWDVIEEACIAQISGELTLTTEAWQNTRVYISSGLVYFAEHDGDVELATRLVLAGVIGHDQLRRIRLNGGEHLGRMFQCDSTIDRDAVELAVEMITEQTLADIAEEPVASIRTALSRQHPTGIARWFSSTQSIDDEVGSVGSIPVPEDVFAAVRRALTAIDAALAPVSDAASVTVMPESSSIPDQVATDVLETPQAPAAISARQSALRRLIDGIRHRN